MCQCIFCKVTMYSSACVFADALFPIVILISIIFKMDRHLLLLCQEMTIVIFTIMLAMAPKMNPSIASNDPLRFCFLVHTK